MKKLILVSTMCAMFAGVSAFGQGYLGFASAKSQVWYGGTIGGGVGSSLSVSFLWASASDVPAIQTLTGMASAPTALSASNSVAWGGSNPNASAWSAILTDPNFVVAVNNTSGVAVAQPVLANGSFNYGNVPLVGSTAGATVYAFEIAWNGNGAFANPGAAATGGAALGWGNVFSYSLTASTQAAGSIGAAASQFGSGYFSAVPEPTTLALAGLGSLGLLLFRRRK